ncbi:MAG TPA: 50S ribosomal protein L6, partial [Methylocella sp.]|nr:50S ribosomal protein L6 [Methylocella sp.]
MSRIGKKPVVIPAGVTAKVEGQAVTVKGSKGELSFAAPEQVSLSFSDGKIAVEPRNGSKETRAMWGMTRAMLNNLVIGVSKGFERKLEINGVGFKAAVS